MKTVWTITWRTLLFCLEPVVTEVENVKGPTPEPVTDISDEDHVENINIIFIGHVGKLKVSPFYFYLFWTNLLNKFLFKFTLLKVKILSFWSLLQKLKKSCLHAVRIFNSLSEFYYNIIPTFF